MQSIIFIIHILAAVSLIALVLLQHGKGADAGAAFGSGASQTMFGSTGSLPFLTKITAIIAAVFFISSLSLGYFNARQSKQQEGTITTIPLTSSSSQSAPATLGTNQAKTSTNVAEKTSAETTASGKAKTAKTAKKIKDENNL